LRSLIACPSSIGNGELLAQLLFLLSIKSVVEFR
jgi:hypothetical protein